MGSRCAFPITGWLLGATLVLGCNEMQASPDGSGSDAGACTSASQCGTPTECAIPVCAAGGICEPGYLSQDTVLTDPTPGDCRALACTGAQADPVSVDADSDLPSSLACSNRACSSGAITAPTQAAGMPCIGESGVCDGAGPDLENCKTCIDTASGFDPDPGCSTAVPICDSTQAGGEGTCHVATTWDPTWSVDGVVYSSDLLSISTSTGAITNIRTTVGRTSGKYYWELAATGGADNAGGIGIVERSTANDTSYIGSSPSGLAWGYLDGTTYLMSWPGATLASGSGPSPAGAIRAGTVYMFALDMDTGSFWAGQNGVWYNGGVPGGVNPVATGITGTVYPGVTFFGGSVNAFTANFGQSPFVYPVPAGFAQGFY